MLFVDIKLKVHLGV